MKTTSYNIRLDPFVKAEAEKTFAIFGLNLSEAINVFLRKAIMERGFPFEVREPEPNKTLLTSFAEAEAMLSAPNLKSYTTIEELNAAMDAQDKEEGLCKEKFFRIRL